MSLDSSSTIAQIEAAYADNSDYAEAGSTAKAAAFIQACRMLLLKRPRRSGGKGTTEIEYDYSAIQSQLEEAVSWRQARVSASTPADSGLVHLSLETFRS